jgi:hypothetical protein
LIQMNCQNRARCVFRIVTDVGEGYLFFSEGRVAHAHFRSAVGIRAVAEMLELGTGTFEPCVEEWPSEPDLGLPPDVLLLRAAQELDESKRTSDGSASTSYPVDASTSVTRLPVDSELPSQVSPAARRPTLPAELGLSAFPRSIANLESERVGLGLLTARVTRDGHVVGGSGPPGSAGQRLADAILTTHRHAARAGEALGLGDCRVLYVTGAKQGLLAYEGGAGGISGCLGTAEELARLARDAEPP